MPADGLHRLVPEIALSLQIGEMQTAAVLRKAYLLFSGLSVDRAAHSVLATILVLLTAATAKRLHR